MKSHGLELSCNQDHLVCPLQSITCHCVVIGNDHQILTWKAQSQVIVQFNTGGQTIAPPTNTNYTVTFEESEYDNGPDELSSNLSFIAQLQSHSVTIQCLDLTENFLNFSYSIVGGF